MQEVVTGHRKLASLADKADFKCSHSETRAELFDDLVSPVVETRFHRRRDKIFDAVFRFFYCVYLGLML